MRYRKRFWIRKVFCEREVKGEFHCLVKELIIVDHELFFKMFRMMPSQFEKLLPLVVPKITKANTRPGVISPAECLCVTLQYLATGNAYASIAASYCIGQTTVSRIVHETAQIIWQSLLEDGHLKVPQHADDWKKIAHVFEKKWNFPNCVGAMDGKHIEIQAPPSSGSLFFNYKKSFSIVLLAVCDGNYRFTLVDIGFADYEINGRQVNGEWRTIIQNDTSLKPLNSIGSNNYSKAAKHTRDSFANYFCSPVGEVLWQWEMYSVDVS
ncbi:uncharacterized protein LOC114530792 [Dendronephthya gigantea]|uniref:uncharacterized protein LOC114530792 n=1 Tax=Dendronephthya gigantea TaxID=151771 RepID=UPI0010695516|nr:uncharacterized protein LOC114530792 [Dendronephthya gigantea]